MIQGSIIAALPKLIELLTTMRKRDMLLIGFILITIGSFGVLTGYIPSPILVVLAQQERIEEQNSKLIDIAILNLYIGREICLQGAGDDVERSRCDRQSIKDAILEEALGNHDIRASVLSSPNAR